MKILKEKRINDYLKIVLAERPNDIEPYVTYLYNEHYNGYAAGHYFDNYADAERDFETRD